jgi:hypothetical protein
MAQSVELHMIEDSCVLIALTMLAAIGTTTSQHFEGKQAMEGTAAAMIVLLCYGFV